MRWLRSLVDHLLDLVLPRACAGCGRTGVDVLCASCRSPGPLVHAAAGAVAAAEYSGPIRAAVLRYKERGRRDLARPLGLLLARAVSGGLAERAPPPGDGPAGDRPVVGAVVLVPVPSAWSAAAARGGDHVRRLARRAAAELDVPVAYPLHLVRAGQDSAGMSAADRARERWYSMTARPPTVAAAGRAAVVVDDIVTTGATLREAARALQAAGWLVIGSATVAATPRIRRDTRSHHWQGSVDRSSVW